MGPAPLERPKPLELSAKTDDEEKTMRISRWRGSQWKFLGIRFHLLWFRILLASALIGMGVISAASNWQEFHRENEDPKDAIIQQQNKELQMLREEMARGAEEAETSGQVCHAHRLESLETDFEADLAVLHKEYDQQKRKLRELCCFEIPGGLNLLEQFPDVALINGRIVEVKNDVGPALVAIDVGSDDNLQKGQRMYAYRGQTFLGKMTVEQVEQDMAAGRLEFLVEKQELHVGDKVTSRLR